MDEGFIAGYIVGFVIVIIINCVIAFRMQGVVEKKGYTDERVVAMCFWLGIIGYLYVIALPDLELRKALGAVKTADTTEAQSEINEN